MRLTELTKAISETQFLVERDVANAPSVKEWVMNLAQRVQDQNARKWFQSQLFNHLINDSQDPEIIQAITRPPADAPDWLYQKIQSGQNVYNITPTQNTETQAQNVIDWINAWSEEHPGSRINYNWEQAVEASDQWHREIAQQITQHGEEDFDDEGLIIFKEYSDGFKWVDVQSETCLKREGGRMGHCVGSYTRQVSRGDTKVLSLRSPKNTPHVTIEVTKPNEQWWLAQATTTNPDQLQMGFMEPKLMQGDTVGEINQIKGKQNQPPVPKYIPYVKDLLDSYPFRLTGYGINDLESIGWYQRDGELKSLEEIARVSMKAPGGHKWVTLKHEGSNAHNWGKFILVDSNWNQLIMFALRATGNNGEMSAGFWRHPSNPKQYREHVMKMLNKFGEKFEIVTDPSKSLTLGTYGIYMGENGRYGTPKEAAGGQTARISEGNFVIHKLYPFQNFGEYGIHFNNKLGFFLFDQNEEPIGMVQIYEALIRKQDNPGMAKMESQIERIVFTSPNSFNGDYTKMILEVSRKLGLQIRDPELFGLNSQYEPLDQTSNSESMGPSSNGHYDYHMKEDKIIVSERGGTFPVAILELDNYEDVIDIKSGRFNKNTDAGTLGYILIDVERNDIAKVPLLEDEYEMIEYGWYDASAYSPALAETWIYAQGGLSFQVETVTTVMDAHGEEIERDQDTTTIEGIDEMFLGAESDSIISNAATILMQGQWSDYREGQMDHNGDGNEELITEEIEVTLVDSRDPKDLTYERWSYDKTKQIIAGGS